MSQYAIVTDLNKCVGCLACQVACKVVNEAPIGKFWNKVRRVGPTPRYEGAQMPDIEMYFLPTQCQHCANPECVSVCPTGASIKREDGIVSIDKDTCIGCGACVSACPYGERYVDEDDGTAHKCTMCAERVEKGELPQCVAQCGARARFFGVLEDGLETFEGPGRTLNKAATYDEVHASRVKMMDAVRPFADEDVHHLADEGNDPQFLYILRDMTWQE